MSALQLLHLNPNICHFGKHFKIVISAKSEFTILYFQQQIA